MPIQQVTPAQAIADYLKKQIEMRERAMVNELGYIGEAATNQARDYNAKSNDYTDQTGNLRSSTGFNLVQNGKVIKESDFEKVKTTATDGPGKGQNLARKIASQSFNGINLVVVAGMEYAGSVSKRGRDVLDSAEIVARKMMVDLKAKFR